MHRFVEGVQLLIILFVGYGNSSFPKMPFLIAIQFPSFYPRYCLVVSEIMKLINWFWSCVVTCEKYQMGVAFIVLLTGELEPSWLFYQHRKEPLKSILNFFFSFSGWDFIYIYILCKFIFWDFNKKKKKKKKFWETF